MDILLHQLLETPVTFDGLLQFLDLLSGNVTGDVPAVFVTLMIVICPVGAPAYDADGALVHALDLGDLLKDGFGREFGVHIAIVYVIHIYYGKRKGKKSAP